MNLKLIVFSILIMVVGLTACSGVETALQSVDEPIAGEMSNEQVAATTATSEPAVVVEATATATENEVDEVVPTEADVVAENTADEATEDAVLEEMAAPTPRADLYATDPATVSLASGDVQLVEMFAFW